jgi:hypothetical protein
VRSTAVGGASGQEQDHHVQQLQTRRLAGVRPSPLAALYVLGVAGTATTGFLVDSPWPILLAAAASLPASLVAMPLFYVVTGLLGLVPGANPSASSGSGSGPAGSTGTETVSGDAAGWFTVTTAVVGVTALTLAAVADVLVVRRLAARRKAAARPLDQSA